MAQERLLALNDVGPDDWNAIQDFLGARDVEAADDPLNVWDARRYDDPNRDQIYLWGRDGWREGFWHARVTFEDGMAWMERSEDERAMPLTRSLALFEECVADALEGKYEEV